MCLPVCTSYFRLHAFLYLPDLSVSPHSSVNAIDLSGQTSTHISFVMATCEKRRTKEKAKMRTKECSLCCNTVPVSRFPLAPHLNGGISCRRRSYCMQCWKSHIAECVASSSKLGVPCLFCDSTLSTGDIRRLASKSTYLKLVSRMHTGCILTSNQTS